MPKRLASVALLAFSTSGFVCLVASGGESRSAGNEAHQKAADELWILSTRHLECPCANPKSQPTFNVFRRDPSGEWHSATEEALRQHDPARATVVYVHGNRIEAEEVEQTALQAYEGLRCAGEPSTRVIFWTWPSDRIPGQLRDVRYKKHRADCEAYHLARFLAHYESPQRLVLVGYSYGARVAVGALHLVGGGSLETAGALFGESELAHVRPAVTLMAPAIDDCSLYNQGEFSQAARQMRALMVLYNSLDPILKRYWATEPSSHPTAMGYVGLPNDCGTLTPSSQQVDLRCEIGRVHHFRYYFGSCRVIELLRSQIRGLREIESWDMENGLARPDHLITHR